MIIDPAEIVLDSKDWNRMEGAEVRGNPSENFNGFETKLVLARAPNYKSRKKIRIRDAKDVYNLVKEEMEAQYTECFLAVMVDINSYLRSVCMIAKGQMDQVLIASSDVVRAPLVTGVRDFYVVHNHPHRGDIEPSDADLKTTMQLSEMASCVGVQLHDHIIVGHDGFISLLDMMGSWLFVKKIIKPPFKRRKPAKKKTTGKKKK